jgi:hypothetical protein
MGAELKRVESCANPPILTWRLVLGSNGSFEKWPRAKKSRQKRTCVFGLGHFQREEEEEEEEAQERPKLTKVIPLKERQED